jgi:hypothetical protein
LPDELELAYLAGVIDSDGFITIQRTVHNGRLYHGARIGITETRPQPHHLASSLWGGRVSLHTPKNPRHRPFYQWSRTGWPAVPAIEAVAPYLRIKGDQAALALQLQEHIAFGKGEDPYPWFGPDYDPTAAREEMRDEMVTLLNQDRRAPLPLALGG